MQDRTEVGSETARRLHLASDIGSAPIELGVQPAPPPASSSLPERYGVPCFEFLVADPDYAFVSWEVTANQLADAQSALGQRGFDERVLQLRLYDANEVDGEPVTATTHALAGFNLYGETGRWFVQPAQPGRIVSAVLGFASGTTFHELQRRGPVSFPRTQPIDAERYVELQVQYERGPEGQLVLAHLGRRHDRRWPAMLPVAARLPYGLAGLDGTGLDAAGWPSSPGVTSGSGVRRGLSLEQEEAGP